MASQCQDGIKDGSEGGADCGGSCATKCTTGSTCNLNSDCSSGFCNATDKLCVATQCEDGTQNGTETDVDCGGASCPKCATGLDCAANNDCSSGFCNLTTNKCVATQCEDGAKDGSETGTDCGNVCPTKCGVGVGCSVNGDCSSGVCNTSTMLCVATQCEDSLQDNMETGIDCGGPCTTKCAVGGGCLVNGDCSAGFCNTTTKLCVATQCEDGAKDGSETDVDCGGATCSKCGMGGACMGNSDCTSGTCTMNVCT